MKKQQINEGYYIILYYNFFILVFIFNVVCGMVAYRLER